MLDAIDTVVLFLCFAGAIFLVLRLGKRGNAGQSEVTESERRKRQFERVMKDPALHSPESRRALAEFRAGR
jgi:hypothetical protein